MTTFAITNPAPANSETTRILFQIAPEGAPARRISGAIAPEGEWAEVKNASLDGLTCVGKFGGYEFYGAL